MDSNLYLRPSQEDRYKFLFTSNLGHLSGEVNVAALEQPDTRSKAEKDDAARRLIDDLAQSFISAAREQLAA